MSTGLQAVSTNIQNLRELPGDYLERVYAGILGKIIGVYLGRPFEGWSHERILDELGEIDQYVHEKLDQPLIVTDDDIAGTFTFLRALEDSGYDPTLTPEQIGKAWLNYLIEERTILWWGGLGMSTEHTAYLRLKRGIPAPASGAIRTNGKTVAEQIGAQIFIDGWAMLFPGDPEAAVDFAARAGSVSHDGEAIYGAQSVAAMEAMAFVENDINVLLDTATSLIPQDSVIFRVINDVREWRIRDETWYDTLHRVQDIYGYDKYLGNCHMVPNHALIILALVWGESDFRQSQLIVNTAGWDTDCNAGNVGAILGIKDGFSTLTSSGFDFRTPVADRMYLSSAEGGRAITDAVQEAVRVTNAGRILHGQEPLAPKNGARFSFALPGSVQGFSADDETELRVTNENGTLLLTPVSSSGGIATTPTFTPVETLQLRTYTLSASPTLHPGQEVRAFVAAPAGPTEAKLIIRIYGADDDEDIVEGPSVELAKRDPQEIRWTIPQVGGFPIASIGIQVIGENPVEIDSITWTGAATTTFQRPTVDNTMWRRAWVDGIQKWSEHWASHPFTLTQNEGVGILSQGTKEWENYEVSAEVTVPLATSAGIAGRIGGMRRYYALILEQNDHARLVRAADERTVLAEVPLPIDPDTTYQLKLRLQGNQITGIIDGKELLIATDDFLIGGAAGFVLEEGTIVADAIDIKAL